MRLTVAMRCRCAHPPEMWGTRFLSAGKTDRPVGLGGAKMTFGWKAVKAALLRRTLTRYRHLAAEFGDHGYLGRLPAPLPARACRPRSQRQYTPIQSAANYSLLFILLQSVVRAQPAEILELGCGETTLLLDALRRSGVWRGNLTSIEHDRFWHEEFLAGVETEIILAPLTERRFMASRPLPTTCRR